MENAIITKATRATMAVTGYILGKNKGKKESLEKFLNILDEAMKGR